jgi:hypothetical protein
VDQRRKQARPALRRADLRQRELVGREEQPPVTQLGFEPPRDEVADRLLYGRRDLYAARSWHVPGAPADRRVSSGAVNR